MPARQFSARKSFELADLLGEAVRGVAGQRDVLPDQALRRRYRTRRQPRRLGVIEVGHDQHGGGMFEQAVRHLLQHQADVFVADLFGHDIERHGGEARMHRPHHPRQHGAVADAGIEDAKRRRRRLQIAKLERDALADLGLLAAGRDEQQVFLAVVEEPEARRRDGVGGWTHRSAIWQPVTAGPPPRSKRARARRDRRGPCRGCRS